MSGISTSTFVGHAASRLTFIGSKSIIETLEKYVEYVQS